MTTVARIMLWSEDYLRLKQSATSFMTPSPTDNSIPLFSFHHTISKSIGPGPLLPLGRVHFFFFGLCFVLLFLKFVGSNFLFK